jgi:hypothetical protein
MKSKKNSSSNSKRADIPWRDRKNGGYKIKYSDGTLSIESYATKAGAIEACKPYIQQKKSQWQLPC